MHLSSSLIDYEEPSKNDFDSIPHLILDRDESVFHLGDPYPHRENFDPTPNSEIISRFKSVIHLKTLPFYQISRSIIINCMGKSTNFKSTLPSQLLKSSCMGSCSNQVLTSEIFGKEFQECQVVNSETFHLLFQSSLVHDIFQFSNSFDWMIE